MKKLAIFSKYFGYNVGGAERSVLELMKREEQRGNKIVAVVAKDAGGLSASQCRIQLPLSWDVREVKLPVCLVRFRFVDYAVNKPALRRIPALISDTDALYAYGNLAPAVINYYRGESVYLVRDEYGLGWNVNYYKGIRGFAQSIYHVSEAPMRALWKRDLFKAIHRSRLIANSRFIAEELRKIAPQSEIEVVPSQVDGEQLIADYRLAKSKVSDELGVVVVGDNRLKGGDIVRAVAARLPRVPFYIFDRRYRVPLRHGNVVYMPWQSPGSVFARAQVVLVPSRWAEAFPRVVLEAQLLGIPVIAARRGGIPEAINDSAMLVSDIDNVEEWLIRIKKVWLAPVHPAAER